MDIKYTYNAPNTAKNEALVNELASAKERLRRRRSALMAKVDSMRTPSYTEGEKIVKGVHAAFAQIDFDAEMPAVRHAIYLCDKLSAAAEAGALRASDGELAFVRRLVKAIT